MEIERHLMNDPAIVFPMHQVGPSVIDDCDVLDIYGDFEHVIYWYETNGFEGAGIAIGKKKDGSYSLHNLSHEAHHGPTEFWCIEAQPNLTEQDIFVATAFNIVFKGEFEGFEDDCRMAISDKITELKFGE